MLPSPFSLRTTYNRKTASNSKVNTRTKNSIITPWPLMIIHKLQEKNILRKKLYCFTIFRTFRQGSVSQGRVPVDVEGASSNTLQTVLIFTSRNNENRDLVSVSWLPRLFFNSKAIFLGHMRLRLVRGGFLAHPLV